MIKIFLSPKIQNMVPSSAKATAGRRADPRFAEAPARRGVFSGFFCGFERGDSPPAPRLRRADGEDKPVVARY